MATQGNGKRASSSTGAGALVNWALPTSHLSASNVGNVSCPRRDVSAVPIEGPVDDARCARHAVTIPRRRNPSKCLASMVQQHLRPRGGLDLVDAARLGRISDRSRETHPCLCSVSLRSLGVSAARSLSPFIPWSILSCYTDRTSSPQIMYNTGTKKQPKAFHGQNPNAVPLEKKRK